MATAVEARHDESAPSREVAISPTTAEDLADPRWVLNKYVLAMSGIEERLATATASERKKYMALLKEGHELAREIGMEVRDLATVLSTQSILDQHEERLREIRDVVRLATGVDPVKKKRWVTLIDETLQVQHAARSSAIAMWAYVGRDSEENKTLRMGEIHRRMFKYLCEDVKGVVIEAPPRHGKTFAAVYGYPLWRLANHPDRRILLLCAQAKRAQRVVRVIREYVKSKPYRALYPWMRILDQQDDSENNAFRFNIPRPNPFSREYSIQAMPISGSIQGDGFDEIICDDVVEPMEEYQIGARERTKDIFFDVIENRICREDRGRFRLVGTPWAEDDLLGALVKQVSDGTRPDWRAYVDEFRIKDDQNGRAISIWKEAKPSSFYEYKKRTLRPAKYARLFGLHCLAQSDRIVRQLSYYPANPGAPEWDELTTEQREFYLEGLQGVRNGEQWLSVDPSATKKKHSSDMAVTHIALAATGRAYVRGVWVAKGDPIKLQRYVLKRIVGDPLFDARFIEETDDEKVKESKRKLAKIKVPVGGGIHYVLIDEQGSQKFGTILWGEYIRRTIEEMGLDWSGEIIGSRSRINQGGQNAGKEIRLRACANYLTDGYLRLPGKISITGCTLRCLCLDYPELLEAARQILSYPSGRTDILDTITQWIIENESRLQRDIREPDPLAQPGMSGTQQMVCDAVKRMREDPEQDELEDVEWIFAA